jgi:hypothetical protein
VHVQCDERPEGCAKCMSSGFLCPGYDRSSDKLFHDETASVVVKAKRSKAKAIAARNARDSASPLESLVDLPVEELSVVRRSSAEQPLTTACQSPTFVLLAPLIDQGINYFMSHYSIGMDEPPVHSRDYHRHLATNGFHPLIATAMTALGLAGVANIYTDTILKRKATSWYLDAIKMVNNAISSPDQVKSDATLLAIMLLSLFEATFNEQSFAGWSNHVNGAAALVKMRGAQQMSTLPGRRMYLHSVALLSLNCLGGGEPMPQYVDDLNGELVQYLDTSDPRERFFFFNNNIINFRAEILRNPNIPVQEIITRALELDDVAARTFDNPGPEWLYEKIPCESGSPLVFGDFYHVYPSLSAAQTYNWWRYSRIYLHDIIRNAILVGLSATPLALDEITAALQLSISNDILQDMQSGILASMPQFLHDVPSVTPHPELLIPFSSSASPRSPTTKLKSISENFATEGIPFRNSSDAIAPNTHRLPILRVSGGHSTIWAAYMTGSMPTATPASRDFARKCLWRFKTEFGINQGKVLAEALDALREKGRPDQGICPAYLPA